MNRQPSLKEPYDRVTVSLPQDIAEFIEGRSLADSISKSAVIVSMLRNAALCGYSIAQIREMESDQAALLNSYNLAAAVLTQQTPELRQAAAHELAMHISDSVRRKPVSQDIQPSESTTASEVAAIRKAVRLKLKPGAAPKGNGESSPPNHASRK